MNFKITKTLLTLLISGLFTYSCAVENTAPNQSKPTTADKVNSTDTTEPKVGSNVDNKFVQSFEPKPTAGTKITYISTAPTGETRESTTEILSVKDEIIKVRLTDPDGSKELEGKNEDFKDDLPKTGIKYEGKEDIKVPAGEHKGATKVSFTNEQGTKVTLWLVKGFGPVKRVDFIKESHVITTELKEFITK